MSSIINIAFFLLFIVNTINAIKRLKPVEISTRLGRISGLIDSNDVMSFRGIPYAVPPVGEKRFSLSEIDETPWTSTFDATHYGYHCIQTPWIDWIEEFTENDAPISSEDCLNLNIWTKSPISTNISTSSTKSVMVWIHGGAFLTGSGTQRIYAGDNIVAQNDIVYVSINYRLGVLGFLAHPTIKRETGSLGSLNGIHDQIVALKWIKNNIQDYGGNPHNITIFGESAGALSICHLLLSPLASGLFNKAILQSQSCTGSWAPMPKALGILFSKYMIIKSGVISDISKLREIPAQELADSISIMWPSIDDYVLDHVPANLWGKTGSTFNADEIIIGFNSVDGIAVWPFYDQYGVVPKTQREYEDKAAIFLRDSNVRKLIDTYYPVSDYYEYNNNNSVSIAWYTIRSDVCVVCDSWKMLQDIISTVNSGYMYEFSGPFFPFYAGHASECAFVFNKEGEEEFFRIPWDEDLSKRIGNSWANFAIHDKPNVDVKNDTYFEWTAYDSTTKSVLSWKHNISVISNFFDNLHHGACSFWNEIDLFTKLEICVDIAIPINDALFGDMKENINMVFADLEELRNFSLFILDERKKKAEDVFGYLEWIVIILCGNNFNHCYCNNLL